ncbi:MAG: hypothetical protein ABJH05_17450 [Fulvivirga sp.]
MAKRQKRFNTIKLISQNIPDLSGKKVNIVLNSSQVLFVTILGIDKTLIAVRNMRNAKSTIDIRDIAEIILDY